jgi:hypothetical protein
MNNPLITFSTCWYNIKSKVESKTYLQWIKNLLSIVNNFNLVIYTNIDTFSKMKPLLNLSNRNIKIIIKPFEDFAMYKYRDLWKKNHMTSKLKLHMFTDWRLNMLWNEKVFFVNDTIKQRYFDTPYYGWCDIGYFRNNPFDLHTKYLSNWPNNEILNTRFNNNCVHYGCIINNIMTCAKLSLEISSHYKDKLTTPPLRHLETDCFAGGFFILTPNLIDRYVQLYDEKLAYYFANNFIIKDDQTIIMDIIFTNSDMFSIHREYMLKYNSWFMFQRELL